MKRGETYVKYKGKQEEQLKCTNIPDLATQARREDKNEMHPPMAR